MVQLNTEIPETFEFLSIADNSDLLIGKNARKEKRKWLRALKREASQILSLRIGI